MATAYRIKNWNRFQHYKFRKPDWIKLYKDILDDPEWYDLDAKMAKRLVMLWLIASEGESGILPCDKRIAFRLRITKSEVESTISALSHWVENIEIANCKQPDSEVIADGVQVDATEKSKSKSKSKSKEETLSSSGDDPRPNGFSPDDMVRLWNEGIDFFAREGKVLIPKVQRLTTDRKKKALLRIRDCQIDEQKWKRIIDLIHHSAFLSGERPGQGHENWKATFDFVVRSESIIVKILEGGYA